MLSGAPRTRAPRSNIRYSRVSPALRIPGRNFRFESKNTTKLWSFNTTLSAPVSTIQRRSSTTPAPTATVPPPAPNQKLVRDLLSRIPRIHIPETVSDLQWSMKDNVPITKELEKLLELYGPQQITSFSLRHLYQFGAQPSSRNLASSANFLRHELPIRFAQRVHLFRDLPYEIHSHPLVVVLQKHYATAFLISLQGIVPSNNEPLESLELFTRRVRYLLYRSSMLSGVAASRAIKIAAQEYLTAVTSDEHYYVDDKDSHESSENHSHTTSSNNGTSSNGSSGNGSISGAPTPGPFSSFTQHKTSARARALRQRLPNADVWVGDKQLRDVDVWSSCDYDEAIWKLYMGHGEHIDVSSLSHKQKHTIEGGAGAHAVCSAAVKTHTEMQPCEVMMSDEPITDDRSESVDHSGPQPLEALAKAVEKTGISGHPESFVVPEFFASVLDEYLDLFHVARLETRLLMTQHSALWTQYKSLDSKRNPTKSSSTSADEPTETFTQEADMGMRLDEVLGMEHSHAALTDMPPSDTHRGSGIGPGENPEPLGSWWPGRASTLHSRVHPPLPTYMQMVAKRNSDRYCQSGAIEHLGSNGDGKKGVSVGVDGWVGVIEVAMAPLDVSACSLAEAVVDAIAKLVKKGILSEDEIRRRLVLWRQAQLNGDKVSHEDMPPVGNISPRVRELQEDPMLQELEVDIVLPDGTISLPHLQHYLQEMYDKQIGAMIEKIGFEEAVTQGKSPFHRTPQHSGAAAATPSKWTSDMSSLLGRQEEEAPIDIPPEPCPPAESATYTAQTPIMLVLPSCLSSALGVQIPEVSVEGEVLYTCRYPRMHLAFVLVELLTNSIENTLISSLTHKNAYVTPPTASSAPAPANTHAATRASLNAAVSGNEAAVAATTGASASQSPTTAKTRKATTTLHPAIPQHECAPSPPIRVLLAQADGIVTVCVEDRAGGIPRDMMKHIWSYGHAGLSRTWAQSSHQEHSVDGKTTHNHHASKCPSFTSGFGLPLARVVMRYMGGDVAISSMQGCGTVAYVTIKTLRTLT